MAAARDRRLDLCGRRVPRRRPRPPAAVERYDIAAEALGARALDAARRSTTRRRSRYRGRLFVHGGYAGATGLSEPHRRAAPLRPAHEALAAASARAHSASGACRGGDPRPAVHRGRRERHRLAAVARGLRLQAAALDGAGRASRGRRATTRPAWPRAGASTCWPGATRRTSRRRSATTRGARRLAGAAGPAHAARRDRVGAPARRPHRGVRGRGARRRAARRSRRSSCSTRARGAGRDLPGMRTPRHGLGGVALGRRVFALEGGPSPGLSVSNTLETLDVPPALSALFPLKDDIPTRRTPIVTIVLIAINVVVYFVFERGLWELGDVGERAGARVRRDPVRDHTEARADGRSSGSRRGLSAAVLGHDRSPRCSCTAACSTSAATCCSCGSSGTTSRTRWAGSRSSPSTCSAGSRRSGCTC